MLSHIKSKRSTPAQAARVILAATLLFGVFASALPLATIANGPMCELACCAGRAPHAAGSCMNGTCQAFLNSHTEKVHIHRGEPREQPEQLCGLSRLTINVSRIPSIESVTVDANSRVDSKASTSSSDQASVSTTVFQKPCQPDCGSCLSGFARSNRQRNAAVLAHADRPRPPSPGGLGITDYVPTKTGNALGYRGVPRGPPSPSS